MRRSGEPKGWGGGVSEVMSRRRRRLKVPRRMVIVGRSGDAIKTPPGIPPTFLPRLRMVAGRGQDLPPRHPSRTSLKATNNLVFFVYFVYAVAPVLRGSLYMRKAIFSFLS